MNEQRIDEHLDPAQQPPDYHILNEYNIAHELLDDMRVPCAPLSSKNPLAWRLGWLTAHMAMQCIRLEHTAELLDEGKRLLGTKVQ